ncbi:Pentatricopeptide repeat [Dillenia turbinata]|uniref:Pentatricopeptide repeat n=1 Tax=Dillenia turbinata TaxID=194707 RepID=A0AAN8UR66_9MAGN
MKLVRFAQNQWRSSSYSQPQISYSLFFSKPISNSSLVRPRKSLYGKISEIGNPNVSIVPILDQWVQEGNKVEAHELRDFIKEFRYFRRYHHALQISEWMLNRRYIPPSQSDIAVRLNLIFKVHGLKPAEEYFDNVPKVLKGFPVYAALLGCYVDGNSVEKAEAVMEKIRKLGTLRFPYIHNHMMNIYYQSGNYEKLDDVMHEMKVGGIPYDTHTYGVRLSAYAAAFDVEGITKIVGMAESDIPADLDCSFFAVAADGYLKVKQLNMALGMLRKLEERLNEAKRRNLAFNILIKLYAKAGMKDEVYRIWNLYKAKEKVYNKGYLSMIGSLLKIDDINGAKSIFEEWESRKLPTDIRIPDLLVSAYSKKGLLEEAEAIIKKAVARGAGPSAFMWYYMARGYLKRGDIEQAREAIKKAISVCPLDGKLKKETLTACLEYLGVKGEKEGAEELIRLSDEDIFSADTHEKLLSLVKNAEEQPI